MNEIKPSEALFVRSLLPHCKRMGAIWLRNTRIMKEQHKNQKIKLPKHRFCKVKNECTSVTNKDNEDLLAMVTVLRKIYKEVHSSSVMELISCWLQLTNDKDTCVLTRGDSRGRMRRIDGWKGTDKVWRLDTLVSMLYHGLPLTSADSCLVHHSCKHDLCVRPQHLRVRLSSLSVVLVLKALSQEGYSIKKDEYTKDKPDEYVDVSGPFSIQKLDVLRHEFVKNGEIENYKLSSSQDDYFILEQNPSLKKYYMIHSKKVRSPDNLGPAKPSNIFKRQLLFRLIENSKQEKLIDSDIQLTTLSPYSKFCQPTKIISPKKFITRSDRLFLGNKYKQVIIPNKTELHGNIAPPPLEGDEKELVEIMTAKSNKQNFDWMDSMLCEISQSPSKSVLDRLIKDIRSDSGSDKDSRDGNVQGEYKIWHGNRNNESEDTNYELLDIFNSARPYLKSDVSFKMTPNIFSPILDIEDIQAAE